MMVMMVMMVLMVMMGEGDDDYGKIQAISVRDRGDVQLSVDV